MPWRCAPWHQKGTRWHRKNGDLWWMGWCAPGLGNCPKKKRPVMSKINRIVGMICWFPSIYVEFVWQPFMKSCLMAWHAQISIHFVQAKKPTTPTAANPLQKKQEKLVCGKCTSCLQNMLGHYSFVFIFFRMVTKGSVSYLSSPCFSTSIGGIGGPARAKRGILAVMYWISIIWGGGMLKTLVQRSFINSNYSSITTQ